MTNTDTRVANLLNSLVGCDFLVTLVETGLSPEVLADPRVSLRLAAASVEFVSIHDPAHDQIASELPALSRAKAPSSRPSIPGVCQNPLGNLLQMSR